MSASSLSDTRSAELYRRALHVLPGGVNSPVRAMRAIGRDPIFIERASGAELTDVDGNVYVDYVCSWGPLIHGHAHPEILEAVTDAAARGTSYGAPTAGEVELAELVCARMPSVDMVRMTSSGTEASMSALRLPRAVTGRSDPGPVSTTLENETIATVENEATPTDWLGDLSGGLGVGAAAGRGWCLTASGRAGPGDRAGDGGAGVGLRPAAEVPAPGGADGVHAVRAAGGPAARGDAGHAGDCARRTGWLDGVDHLVP